MRPQLGAAMSTWRRSTNLGDGARCNQDNSVAAHDANTSWALGYDPFNVIGLNETTGWTENILATKFMVARRPPHEHQTEERYQKGQQASHLPQLFDVSQNSIFDPSRVLGFGGGWSMDLDVSSRASSRSSPSEPIYSSPQKWIETLRAGNCITENELKLLCNFVKDILVSAMRLRLLTMSSVP